jgi:hypothetical protein
MAVDDPSLWLACIPRSPSAPFARTNLGTAPTSVLPVIQEESGESITNEPRADLSILIDCAGCPRVLAEAHYPQPGVDAASGSAAVPGSVAQI